MVVVEQQTLGKVKLKRVAATRWREGGEGGREGKQSQFKQAKPGNMFSYQEHFPIPPASPRQASRRRQGCIISLSLSDMHIVRPSQFLHRLYC